jgi:hypothetical protein
MHHLPSFPTVFLPLSYIPPPSFSQNCALVQTLVFPHMCIKTRVCSVQYEYEEHRKHTSVCYLAHTLPPPTSQCTTRLCLRLYSLYISPIEPKNPQATRSFTHSFAFNLQLSCRSPTPNTSNTHSLTTLAMRRFWEEKGSCVKNLFFTLFFYQFFWFHHYRLQITADAYQQIISKIIVKTI